MYRMVVIDDEKVEREGIACFIDWKQYDIQIVGDAANGMEGLRLIREKQPDIILTDIKMPIMNGIEMIRNVISDFPNSIFVVLSGYGDYEYTSQAMLLGVKYYILKPCDEEGLARVLKQVKKELEEKRQERLYENEKYDSDVRKLLPRAKVHFFKSALTNSRISEEEIAFYRNACGLGDRKQALLVFRGDPSENSLSAFVVENIFEELVGQNEIIMKTELGNDVIFLLQGYNPMKLKNVIRQVLEQFKKIFGMELRYALIEEGSLENTYCMYEKAVQILKNCTEKLSFILEKKDLAQLKAVSSLEGILFVCHTMWILFKIAGANQQDLAEGFVHMLTQSYGGDERYQMLRKCNSSCEVFKQAVSLAKEKCGLKFADEEIKMEKILILLYEYMADHRLSMQWLAKEVLYMNEDYLGRLFKTNMKRKVPDYLSSIRMETAKQILLYDRNFPLEDLAYYTGYNEDGQYFCRVFKKYFNCSLSEYREKC